MIEPNLTNHPRLEMAVRGSLTPNPKNPRKHSDRQLEQIAQSIRRFGFLVPIIIDEEHRIVAGAGRWAAAGLMGLEDVPVIRAAFLTEADRRAFALAENRLGDLSEFDDVLLGAELEYLFEQDYDLDVTGFAVADLDMGIGVIPEEEPVELPDPHARAISRPGDLWMIGPHRLYCGNARDAMSYAAVLGEERAAMIFCDPPYNVKVDGHVSGLGRLQHREFAEASGEMTAPEFVAFLSSIFRNCVRFSIDGSIHYHCMDWRHMRDLLEAGAGVYDRLMNLAVWVKPNGGMGSFYRSRHELVFIYRSGKGRHINNFGLGEKRYRCNVWEYAGSNSFRKGRDADLAAHPTVKPLAMVVDAILDCSNRGDWVLDPTAGAGTTLLAAHRTKRRGAAIEIDPLYVDTSLRRLQATSGLTPQLADGRTFEEVALARWNEAADHG